MPGRLTVLLWPTPRGLAEESLLGRLVWQRTLDAVRRAKGVTALVVDGSRAPRLRRPALHLPAELPCLTPRALKELPPEALSTAPPRGKHARETLGLLRARAEDETDWLWVRSASDLARAATTLRRRKCAALAAAGVVIEDPATTLVDPEVVVGRGARLCAFVLIEGRSRIGPGAEIGRFTHVLDSVVGNDTVVLDHCFIRSSRIGKGAQLGPFAHLRPESDVRAGARIGNFVELKKTLVERGSKVPHLTYLGDTIVGRRVNVGAGTITCNYDGRVKHQTIIEDGAFIGSDVQLVAPVRVGRGAYVAAGSCIVEDVPAQALALARSRQVVKPGWARRRARVEPSALAQRERSESRSERGGGAPRTEKGRH